MTKMKVDSVENKILFPVGGGLDIPNASFTTGAKGETLINGGIDASFANVGPANSFKTSFLQYVALTLISRYGGEEKYVAHYDTEVNVKTDRINKFAEEFPSLPKPLISDDPNEDPGIWQLTDKSKHYADEWAAKAREFIALRSKDKRVEYTAYSIPTKKALILTPTVGLIDSLTMFEPSTTVEMLEKQKKEDGKANTYYMKQGAYTDKFISEIPVMTAKGNFKLLLSAHVGKKIDMAASPYAPKETKQLSFLKEGEYLKGVSPKFMYLTSMVYYSHTGKVLKNYDTKMPEYPLPGDESLQTTDLMLVQVQPLRSKAGSSGYLMPLIFSQKSGFLPDLSAYHYIKNLKETKGSIGYGFEGNSQHFSLSLLPDVKLSKNKVRGKINQNPRLRRALNITQELHQLKIFHPHFLPLGLYCEPAELYQSLVDKGYNWDELLDTINYAPIDSYSDDMPPHLSIIDLLNMRLGLYHPYWMES